MKKYLLGIFAVLLAIGFSAFTSSTSLKKKNVKTNDLYWYFYDAGTDELAGQILTGQISHATAKDETECPDRTIDVIDCARGFLEEQNPTQSEPDDGLEQVKRPVEN